MEHGTYLKLSFMVVMLVAFPTFLSPFTVEARPKHGHHNNNNNGHHQVKYFPLPPPPCIHNDMFPPPPPVYPPSLKPPAIMAPSPSPSPSPIPDNDIETPPPEVEDHGSLFPPRVNTPWYEKAPPYVTHGCGHPCADSNDCDWPCTVCCWNQTCCNDWPELPYTK